MYPHITLYPSPSAHLISSTSTSQYHHHDIKHSKNQHLQLPRPSSPSYHLTSISTVRTLTSNYHIQRTYITILLMEEILERSLVVGNGVIIADAAGIKGALWGGGGEAVVERLKRVVDRRLRRRRVAIPAISSSPQAPSCAPCLRLLK